MFYNLDSSSAGSISSAEPSKSSSSFSNHSFRLRKKKVEDEHDNKEVKMFYNLDSSSIGSISSAEPSKSSSSFSNHSFRLRKKKVEEEYDNKEEFEYYEERSLREMGYIPKFEREWGVLPQKNKSLLPWNLKHILKKRVNANYTILVGDEDITLHLIPFQVHSTVFRRTKHERCIRLHSKYLSVHTITKMYRWMIKPNAVIQRQNVMELLKGSIVLKMKELYTHICAYICSNELFVEESAFLLFTEARPLNLPNIEMMLLNRISKFFLILVSSNDFDILTAYELTILLQSQYVSVNTEIEVFLAVIHWVNKDFERRKQYLLGLLQDVKFELIPAWYVVQFRNDNECGVVERILAIPGVSDFLNAHLTFGNNLLYYPFEKIEYPDVDGHPEIVKPQQRIWIFDRNCSYHHALYCQHKKYFSYTEFTMYLAILQIMPVNYFKEFVTITSDHIIHCCNVINPEFEMGYDDTTVECSSNDEHSDTASGTTDITLFMPSAHNPEVERFREALARL
ncbi:uncharacterized protein LOC119662324 [Teleopsis dalmanni]|uniref:uncharacterized protein LOC119662324 n=1 Tax=Teleopsis dalmanni TaxID=139649 RepID=UPI0018CF568C|nr:uncharacterized protein LOC119662324 [Teleopsis dalmanni]XP_037927850.1 uncharacterized protein LOC119662324 [Teleopsis dalmanni]